jgi:PAS domain S-box-containing protein
LPDAGAPGRGSLATRLIAGAALVAVAVALVVAMLVRSTVGLADAQRATLRSERTLSQNARTERLTVDLESGLRGYVLTRERRFLAPFIAARREAPRAATRLRRLAEGADQTDRAVLVGRLIGAYLSEYAEPVLEPGRTPRDGDQAVAFAAEGKRRLDALRSVFARIDAVERERLAQRAAAADRRSDSAVLAGLLALAAVVALVFALALFVYRAVVRPVRDVARAVERMRDDDLEVSLDAGGPAEIARLGSSTTALARSLADSRRRLEQSNTELRRLSERNLVLLDAVYSQTPAGLALLDLDLRFVRVNAAMAAINGAALEAHIGRRFDEVLPGLDPRLFAALDEVVRSGQDSPELEVRGETPAEPGVERTWSVTYYPVREHGEVVGIGAVVLDITDRKRVEAERAAAFEGERRARDRATLLAEAGVVLDSSLDPDEAAAAFERFCVPRFADRCSVAMGSAGQRDADAGELVVPLTARGRTFGSITFGTGNGRSFTSDDRTLAQDLGSRAALALDNARLYRERAHVAQTLQASLLPERLPDVPGIVFAARFEPHGAATEVGGDFYDVFELDEERWAVVIGDVCGKGAEAAALTALARYTLRAAAPLAPVEALRHLNQAILRQRDDLRFITMVYAELDLRGGRVRVSMANGGHPPPLLLRPSGSGEIVSCRGTLIGVTPDPDLEECVVELEAGDVLALYTDGVTEASHSRPLDGEDILTALSGVFTADAVADGLQRLARLDGAPARDDVAILTFQVA